MYKFAAAWKHEPIILTTGRNPYEAAIAAVVSGQNPFKVVGNLNMLFNQCRIVGRDE